METKVLDAHSHAFPDAVAPAAMKSLLAGARYWDVRNSHDGTVAGLLAIMDRAGVARTFMCSVATRPSQVAKITDWSASVASGRIIPFASIHPDFDQPEREVERIAALGLKGLKFHSQYMNCAADDPRCLRIARAAGAAGLAMVFHGGLDLAYEPDDIASPARFRRLYDLVPELAGRLLICHLGGWRCWEEVLTHLAGLPIYLDTSFTIGQCPDDLLRRIITRHPAEYLLFGTDSPWADQAAELASFRRLPLNDRAMGMALWSNAHRFAGMDEEL